ncbi:hypothetical protein MJT46_015978 [Ovis ammon polii x Ovis aries]|nr:hypothetical protein MJT46_015978 [Ovis ammon polii x Ovis aries]
MALAEERTERQLDARLARVAAGEGCVRPPGPRRGPSREIWKAPKCPLSAKSDPGPPAHRVSPGFRRRHPVNPSFPVARGPSEGAQDGCRIPAAEQGAPGWDRRSKVATSRPRNPRSGPRSAQATGGNLSGGFIPFLVERRLGWQCSVLGEDEEELELQINFDEWVQGEDTGKLETEAKQSLQPKGDCGPRLWERRKVVKETASSVGERGTLFWVEGKNSHSGESHNSGANFVVQHHKTPSLLRAIIEHGPPHSWSRCHTASTRSCRFVSESGHA